MIVSFARYLGGKPSSVKMAFYGGLTPKHLDAVAFKMYELFYINKYMVVYIFRTGPNGPDWTEGIKFGLDRTKFFY